MAYSQEEKQEVIFPKIKESESYRKDNARKVNSKKKPNGYLYILQNKQFDLIKIGVSANPKRRIRDIKANLPFDTDCVFLNYYKDVYYLEELIHQRFKNNQIKGEWFQVYNEDVMGLKNVLKAMV